MTNWIGLGLIIAASVAIVPVIDHVLDRTEQTQGATSGEPAARDQVVLRAGRNGHFVTDVLIDGRRINVMVDTGASGVSLTYEDARRLGLNPGSLDYSGRSRTANGIAEIAPIMLDKVTLDGITVRDVRGSVARQGALSVSLLGMSFIGRIERFELTGDRLILSDR